MKRRGDPNGIRTRVTAVKGRCPGPLDDRVIWRLPDGQYRNCRCLTQGKLATSGTDALQPTVALLGAKLVNQRGCARGCALVLAQNFTRTLNESLARFAVVKKLGECLFK